VFGRASCRRLLAADSCCLSIDMDLSRTLSERKASFTLQELNRTEPNFIYEHAQRDTERKCADNYNK